MLSKISSSFLHRSLALLTEQGTTTTIDQGHKSLNSTLFSLITSASDAAPGFSSHVSFSPSTAFNSTESDFIELIDRSRSNHPLVTVANWFSLIGSLLIIFHAPMVMQRVPAQRKRMVIIFLTAVSNFGFALANVITDYTSASTRAQCTVSAWCYVFFQLLTCTLVISSTSRLCGVFLFTERRSIPFKYIAVCPLIAFVLATAPAATRHFNFNECGHYCWFTTTPGQTDCKVRSFWAWFCFYAWMILFLIFLFGSTLFVMFRITLAVIRLKADLNKIACQAPDYLINKDASSRSTSTMERLRSISQSVRSKRISLLSNTSRQSKSIESQEHGVQEQRQEDRCVEGLSLSGTEVGARNDQRDEQGHEQMDGSCRHRNYMITSNPSPTFNGSDDTTVAPTVTITDIGSSIQHGRIVPSISPNGVQQTSPRGMAAFPVKDRSYLAALLRQAFYPISISVSGCIQIFVDLTLSDRNQYDGALDYFVNVATSIQGFLFFIVFIFDPAVVQTYQYWRKYLVWKYYIEFYYSLGMPFEAREFQERFREKCQTLNPHGNDPKTDQLTKPPPYSWSLRCDDLATPSEFYTTYPFTVTSNMDSIYNASQAPQSVNYWTAMRSNKGSTDESVSGVGNPVFISPAGVVPKNDKACVEDLFTDSDAKYSSSVPVKKQHQQQYDNKIMKNTDFPHTSPGLFSDTALLSQAPGIEDIRVHPMMKTNIDNGCSTSYISPYHESNEATGQAMGHNTTKFIPTPEEQRGLSLARPLLPYSCPNLGPDYTTVSIQEDPTLSYYSRAINDPTVNNLYDKNLKLDLGPQRPQYKRRRSSDICSHQPGGIISPPKPSKTSTIGGNDWVPGCVRSSKSSSADRGTLRTSADLTISGGSFSVRIGSFIPIITYAANCSIQERYQQQFRFPKWAYLIHRVIRRIFIPSEVRMPPIPNPFAKESRRARVQHQAMLVRKQSEIHTVHDHLRSPTNSQQMRRTSEVAESDFITLPDPIHPRGLPNNF